MAEERLLMASHTRFVILDGKETLYDVNLLILLSFADFLLPGLILVHSLLDFIENILFIVLIIVLVESKSKMRDKIEMKIFFMKMGCFAFGSVQISILTSKNMIVLYMRRLIGY